MEFIEKHKRAVFVLAVAVCIIASVITLNYKKPNFIKNLVGYAVAPTTEAASGIGGWFEEKIDFISNLNELENRNKELLEEIERLKVDVSRIEILEKDNERLASQLSLKGRYPSLPLVGAYVSAKDSNNWSSAFLIDKGRADGLEENMVVLSDGGLVGKIYEADAASSMVVPIMDDSSSVGAQTKRTGEMGFVTGDLRLSESGYCRMENIDVNADISENDEIITSLLGDIYPPGITIGFVREVQMDEDGLTKQAIISPVVDFRHLDTVLVVNEVFSASALEDDEEGALEDASEDLAENSAVEGEGEPE